MWKPRPDIDRALQLAVRRHAYAYLADTSDNAEWVDGDRMLIALKHELPGIKGNESAVKRILADLVRAKELRRKGNKFAAGRQGRHYESLEDDQMSDFFSLIEDKQPQDQGDFFDLAEARYKGRDLRNTKLGPVMQQLQVASVSLLGHLEKGDDVNLGHAYERAKYIYDLVSNAQKLIKKRGLGEASIEEMTRKERSKKNKAKWAKMSPEEKKKFDASNKKMPYSEEDDDGHGQDLHEKMEYHHVRVSDPDNYKRIRTITFGKGIKARVGWADGSSKVVSILFPKDKYSIGQAKKWAKKHEYKILKSMKAQSKDYKEATYESGETVLAYNTVEGTVVEQRGEIVSVEWDDDYDGPDLVHTSWLSESVKLKRRPVKKRPTRNNTKRYVEYNFDYKGQKGMAAVFEADDLKSGGRSWFWELRFAGGVNRNGKAKDKPSALKALKKAIMAGQSRTEQVEQPQVESAEYYDEPEDPMLETILASPQLNRGNIMAQSLSLIESQGNGMEDGFKSPLFDFDQAFLGQEERPMEEGSLPSNEPRQHYTGAETVFFTEDENPHNAEYKNLFDGEFWGAS